MSRLLEHYSKTFKNEAPKAVFIIQSKRISLLDLTEKSYFNQWYWHTDEISNR